MIKIIFCLRRLPSLSRAEFQTYWDEKHAPLVRRLAPVTNVYRYVQSHTFFDPRIAPAAAARGSVVEDYDGVAELWWETIEMMIAVGDTPEGRAAGRAMLADERNFIDLPNSPMFYVKEHEIIPGPLRAGNEG